MSSAKKQRELNRAKVEHDKAKLSAQFSISNHTMLNIAESIAAKRIEELTRQRDLAVSALQFYRDHGICAATYYNVRDALAAIKESENN